MIRHVWSVLCKTCFIDQETNCVSMVEALEQIQIHFQSGPELEKPIQVPAQFSMVTLLARDPVGVPEKGEMRMQFLSPTGKALNTTDIQPLDLTRYPRLRVRATIGVLHLQGNGTHWIVVELKQQTGTFQEATRLPLQCDLALRAPAPAAPPPAVSTPKQ